MNNLKVSIVICTYNRAPFLKRTLESLKNLDYKNYEVVVVNGPSTDETSLILEEYKDKVKIRNNPLANLSVSRNIGIKAAAGDIVAFIDDDAIPEPEWLNDLVSYYTDDKVGGVGGKVFGPGGDHFQFTNGIIDIWGEATALRDEEGNYNDPKGELFNIMMGTNCSFSRKALEEVGGFDEYYEYYHDESDVAVRVIKAGYIIKHHPRAYIHHEFAKSHIRTNIYKLNWYPIVKNTVYFGLKNSEGYYESSFRKQNVTEVAKKRLKEFKKWYSNKQITKEDYEEFSAMWDRGYKQGLEDGLSSERKLNYDISSDSEFLKYVPYCNISRNTVIGEKLNICLLSQEFPVSAVGGIGRYTWQLAQGLVHKGHNVHIITKQEQPNSWLQDGVNIHTISEEQIKYLDELKKYEITNKNLSYSYSVYKKIKQINKQYRIDVIETPIWDYEGVLAAKLLEIPVVTRLETPLLKVVETQKWTINDDIKLSADFEKKLLELSKGIISISDNIKQTISSLYNINLDNEKNTTIYLGLDDIAYDTASSEDNGEINILFVGRLERRKGVHVLLEAIPEILQNNPNVKINLVGNDEILNEKGMTYKDEFIKKHGKQEYATRVRFLGKVDENELMEQYKSCDIFVAPSLYESFGIVFLEAMRFAKPVIGCKAGGMQEIIIDGETGLLAEPNNKESLVSCLNALIEDKEFRRNLGIKGQERFKEAFTQEKMVERTIELYKHILSRH
ncbi:glycosyltransferase [Geosporobacter ferrireducens]|uniref:glycosyltransferase n=1 Tax=Geosporobacter ferrireducens TaxID=1424294 RepID=UPI0023568B35|nr:glycosyltransferase [Geosporobacter ferrireducens]